MKANLFILLCILKSISCDPTDNQKVHHKTRIVGGYPAPNGKAPFMCSIQLKTWGHICGCAIISSKWIITAAHCIQGKDKDKLFIIVGTNNYLSDGQVYNIERFIVHPNFMAFKESVINDVGLIRVIGEIQYNSKVGAIKYGKREVPAGTELLALGWGGLHEGDFGPRDLQEITPRALSHQDCKEAWPEINDSVLCIVTLPGKSMCNGDSGGPLVWGDTLVGLTSFGERICAKGDKPDAFTNVPHFYDWIRENTN